MTSYIKGRGTEVPIIIMYGLNHREQETKKETEQRRQQKENKQKKNRIKNRKRAKKKQNRAKKKKETKKKTKIKTAKNKGRFLVPGQTVLFSRTFSLPAEHIFIFFLYWSAYTSLSRILV